MTLLESKPKIWRRVLIQSDILLSDFHKVIQTTMGWTNSHLHQFIKNETHYSERIPEDMAWDETGNVEYLNMKLSDLLKKEEQRILYGYDYGDGWTHDLISFEKVPLNFRQNIIDRFRPFLSDTKVTEIIKQLETKPDIEITKIFRDEAFPIEQSALAVTCFSEKNDNLLMWSHYSDSHRGICLGFDLQKLYLNFKKYHPALIKVKYTDQLERIDYFSEKKKAIINWFRIKSDSWSYEKEVRIVLTNLKMDPTKHIAIPFDTETINSIYLGTNIKPGDENTIRLLAFNKLPKAKIFNMRLKEDSFSLIPE